VESRKGGKKILRLKTGIRKEGVYVDERTGTKMHIEGKI